MTEFPLLCLFAAAGFMWSWVFFGNTPKESELLNEAKQIIKECESTIPRNQTCQLKAVVKEEVVR